jgi:predicted FMN-binding regulatory protein PaiB/uncharacterized protein YbcV (DUF1398 family)
MYLPKHFLSEWMNVQKLISEYGFATILSFPKNEKPFINHLPLILESDKDPHPVLIGHMAKRNPQWRHFKEDPSCTVIINGPHSYISPRWYRSGRDVPTWNYAVAHLHGKIELIEEFDEQVKVLKQLSEFYEKPSAMPWEFELPDDLLDAASLTSAIISFGFSIESVEAKFKLSQNRSKEDRDGVIDGLNERDDDSSRAIHVLMSENELKLKLTEKLAEKLIEAQKYAMSIRPKVGGFPVLAEVLRQAGVLVNRWTLPSCQAVYLMKEGSVVQQGTPLVTGTHDIPKFNRDALISALQTDQEGKSSFPEFLRGIWKAGVVGYDVDFTERKVNYYGASGESYLEEYASIEGFSHV